VTPQTTTLLLPSQSSTVSSLTQCSQGGDSNQILQDVLYGEGDIQSLTSICLTLSISNLGLWHLIITDILQLQENDQLFVILSPTSRLLPVYKGFIQQQVRQTNRLLSQPSRLELVDKLLPTWHEFQCLNASYYEFCVVIRANPKRHLLYDDAIDAATWGLWLAQGEGF
jgi:sRNA-binding regulator protein Hfq